MSFTTKTKKGQNSGGENKPANKRKICSQSVQWLWTHDLWVCVCFSVDIHWQDCVCECVNVRSSTWMFSSWYSRSVLSVFSRSVWSRASCSPWVRRKMWVFWASICCCSFSCCGGDNSCYIIIWTLWPCSFANSHNWFLHMIAAAQPFSPWCDFANREENTLSFWHLICSRGINVTRKTCKENITTSQICTSRTEATTEIKWSACVKIQNAPPPAASASDPSRSPAFAADCGRSSPAWHASSPDHSTEKQTTGRVCCNIC